MKTLVEIRYFSGEVDVVQRIELAPNAVEYRRVPCQVVGVQQRATRILTWFGVGVAISVISSTNSVIERPLSGAQ